MTTAQESPNGHHAPPPPCPLPDPQDLTRGKDSTGDHNPHSAAVPATRETTTFSASAYHVPPELFAPKADSFRDPIPEGLTTMKLPDRCQFMFSDGRQCAMARSGIHPSLCTYHSDREEQLFGDPAQSFISSKLDLLELSAACRDLTTAAGVSRALAVVFRLLAQRRISRQEAATFAKLGQLLLRSISAARAESAESHSGAANVYQQDELRGVKKEELAAPANAGISRAASPADTSSGRERPVAPSRRGAQEEQQEGVNSNSSRISTYKMIEDKPVQNEHFHKNGAGVCSLGRLADVVSRRAT